MNDKALPALIYDICDGGNIGCRSGAARGQAGLPGRG